MENEKGILRLYIVLKHKKCRLESFYNVNPDEQDNIVANFREEYPYLRYVPIHAEFCYRVKSDF